MEIIKNTGQEMFLVQYMFKEMFNISSNFVIFPYESYTVKEMTSSYSACSFFYYDGD